MKKTIYAVVFLALLFSSCANEFNKVYKSTDNNFKYEYAKECFAKGKYVRASTLLQGLVTMQKGYGQCPGKSIHAWNVRIQQP